MGSAPDRRRPPTGATRLKAVAEDDAPELVGSDVSSSQWPSVSASPMPSPYLELLAYHRMGEVKSARLGWPLPSLQGPIFPCRLQRP